MPQTMFEKIWDRHVVEARPDGQTLLYVDRHLLHEGSFHGFEYLEGRGMPVRRPAQTFAVADHYVPTVSRNLDDAEDEAARSLVERLAANTAKHGVTHFGIGDAEQGIVHVIGPEQGITLPGLLIVCGDSHTATHGALGAYAFGIGASEVTHVLATQTLWQIKPKAMRISVEGARPARRYRQGRGAGDHRRDFRRRRHRPCGRVRGLADPRSLDGRAHDGLQHDDRGRRPAPA